MSDIGRTLDELFAVLEQRRDELPSGSYTAKLLSEPQDKLLAKIAEEGAEVIMAARDGDAQELRYELADLVYHVLVVMVREGVTLDELAAELSRRAG
jgi:phosphoribosyl-ATP pyrophosphohydrolase